MSLLYRKYAKVVAKWPVDEFKSHSRNLRNYLEIYIEKNFIIDSTGQRYLENVEKTQLFEQKLKGILCLFI